MKFDIKHLLKKSLMENFHFLCNDLSGNLIYRQV